jgi:hypothetical protein
LEARRISIAAPHVARVKTASLAAILIEPDLRRQSLQNGIFAGVAGDFRRLAHFDCPIWDSRDKTQWAKSRDFRPVLALSGERGRIRE